LNEFFEHTPAVPPRLVRNVPRLEPGWLDRFSGIRTPDLADHVGLLYTMDPGIKGLYQPMRPVVGQALTVKAWPGDGLAVYGAIGLAQDGDIMVIDGRSEVDVSRGGFHVLSMPRKAGMRGVIVDGAIRDIVEFQEVDFPVFGRSGTPHASAKRRPGEVNVPIACGGVIVEPGDLVVADSEGIVVVPRTQVARVWDAVEGSSPLPTDDATQRLKHSERTSLFQRAFDDLGGQAESWLGAAGWSEPGSPESFDGPTGHRDERGVRLTRGRGEGE
jgi:4-hydroxy-4-methyl-2-oxoglutarate aldolase